MKKLGRKIASANGEAKATYANKLPTDVIAQLRDEPNAAQFMERALRKEFAVTAKRKRAKG